MICVLALLLLLLLITSIVLALVPGPVNDWLEEDVLK